MLDTQQAHYLPNIHLKMVRRHFEWLFKCLPLLQIKENKSNHGEIKERCGCVVLWWWGVLFGISLQSSAQVMRREFFRVQRD
jgi:hypothetical protein